MGGYLWLMPFGTCMWLWLPWFITMPSTSTSSAQKNEKNQSTAFKNYVYQYNLKVMKCTIKLFVRNVPLPTEVPGTAARFVYHWGRQLKSQQNEGFLCQYWAKRGAVRCPECNADSSIGSRGCKQIGLQGRVWGRYRTLFTNTNNYKTLW